MVKISFFILQLAALTLQLDDRLGALCDLCHGNGSETGKAQKRLLMLLIKASE
jgi:hypothetical protein